MKIPEKYIGYISDAISETIQTIRFDLENRNDIDKKSELKRLDIYLKLLKLLNNTKE